MIRRAYLRGFIRYCGLRLKAQSDFVVASSVCQNFGEPHPWEICVGRELRDNFTNPSGLIILNLNGLPRMPGIDRSTERSKEKRDES